MKCLNMENFLRNYYFVESDGDLFVYNLFLLALLGLLMAANNNF